MGRLSLFAIGITELREIFGAAPQTAARLRDIATHRFAAPAGEHRRRGTLLGQIGPLLKRPIDQTRAPSRPVMADMDALLTGRSISPERLGHAWQITLAWLAELSWGQLHLDVTTQQIAQVEFALAKAGLSTAFGLEKLFHSDPQIPLRPLTRQRFGYSENSHVQTTKQALSKVIDDVDEESLPIAGAVLEFLNDFDGWTQQAATAGRPAPDLIAVWMG